MSTVNLCEVHGIPTRTEPLGVGTLTLDVCDLCDQETEDNLAAFLQRVRDGDFGDTR